MQEYNRWENDQQQPYDTREWPGRDRGGQMYGGGREYSGRDIDRERGGHQRGRSEQYPSERTSNAGWGGDDRTSMRRDYEREVRGNDAGYRSAGYGSRDSESGTFGGGYGRGYGGGYSGTQGYSPERYGMRSQGGNRTRSEGGMNSGQYGADQYYSQGTAGGQYGMSGQQSGQYGGYGNRGYGSGSGNQGNQNWGSNQGYGQSSGYGAQHFGSQNYADHDYGSEYGGNRGSSTYGGGAGYGGMQGGQHSGQNYNQSFGRQSGIGSAVDEGYRGYQSSHTDGGMGQQWNQGQRGSSFGKGPKNYQRSDSRIEEDVNDRLTQAGEIDASDIEVKVSECEVTLTGTVSDRSDKFRAEQIAESVFGVKDVNNQIKVKKNGGMGRSSSSEEESGSQKSKNSSDSTANGGASGSQKQGSQTEQKRSTFAST